MKIGWDQSLLSSEQRAKLSIFALISTITSTSTPRRHISARTLHVHVRWSVDASFCSGTRSECEQFVGTHTGCWPGRTKRPEEDNGHWIGYSGGLFIIQPQQCPKVECWVTAGEERMKLITWSCPRCTAQSCPELFQKEPSGPRCVWWPGRRGAEGGGWWWRSPVSSEVHGSRSGLSCRAQKAPHCSLPQPPVDTEISI